MVQATIESSAVTNQPAPQAIADALWRVWQQAFESAATITPASEVGREPLWTNDPFAPEFGVLNGRRTPAPPPPFDPEADARAFLRGEYL
jgi:hypothetical protein